MLRSRRLELTGLLEIVPPRYADNRGYFSETFSRADFSEIGIDCDWCQDNHSLSRRAGTLRGLHYQLPPRAQAKLVRVVRGAVYDVTVDLRQDSSTFGCWTGLELSAELGNQLFIPVGFAHGFITIEPDTEVLYKVDAPWSEVHERTVRWDDPELLIKWPDVGSNPILSVKDAAAPDFRALSKVMSWGR